ncbi:cytochrome c [Flavobacterium sp.]
MKYKLPSLAVIALIIYSCASKSSVPTIEVKKEAPAATTVSGAPTAIGPTVMTPELAEGKSLYENNCANCHRLYKSDEFSAEEWRPIVARMAKKSHLDAVQEQKVYNYITMK